MLNKNQWLAIAIAYTVLLCFACLTTIKIKVAPSIDHKDKLVHIGIYIIYTIVWFIYYNHNRIKANYNKVILFAFFTGVTIEILQGTITASRSSEIADVVANGIGIAIAVILLKHYYPKIKGSK